MSNNTVIAFSNEGECPRDLDRCLERFLADELEKAFLVPIPRKPSKKAA